MILLVTLSMSTITVTSPDFQAGKSIPEKFTCDSENVNPGITLTNIPKETVSLALIMDDPDAPGGDFVHWVVYNIEPGGSIRENTVPGIEGSNGRGTIGYTGPCPPTGEHHYHFKIYALDTRLNLPPGASKKTVQDEMAGHILATGELMGVYSRKK